MAFVCRWQTLPYCTFPFKHNVMPPKPKVRHTILCLKLFSQTTVHVTLCNSYIISVSDGMSSMYGNPDSLLKRLYHRLACEDLLTHTLKCALHNLPQIYSVLTEQWTPDQVTSIHPNIFRRSVFLSTTLLVLLKWTESLITSSQPSHLSELSLSVNPDARLQPSLTLEVF